MQKLKFTGALWIFSILLFGISSCDALSEADTRITELQNVLENVNENLEQAQEIIHAVKSYATLVEGSKFFEAVESIPTQFAESNLLETAQSIATLNGPALLQTVQDYATEQVPRLHETAKAVATRFPTPPDIPVMKGDKKDFWASAQEVKYTVDADLQSVQEYYEQEMPILGWQQIDSSPVSENNRVELQYQKHDRQAVIMLRLNPDTHYTSVQIILQDV